MNQIMNPGSSGDESKRLKLKEERQKELAEYLLQQANNKHPRLQRILKNQTYLQTNLQENTDQNGSHYLQKPSEYRMPRAQQQESLNSQPIHQIHEREPEDLKPVYHQPPPTQYNPMYSNFPIQYPMNYQVPVLPWQNSMYDYRPNPGFNKDPFPNLYQQNQHPYSFPYHPPNLQPNTYQSQPHRELPEDSKFSKSHNERYLNHSPSFSQNSREHEYTQQKSHRGHGAPQLASKAKYAEQLQTQIEEKRKQKEREKNYRLEPDNGFLSNNTYGNTKFMRDIRPSKKISYNYNQDCSNINANSKYHHSRNDLHLEGRTENREQQQSKYLRELDEQIRLKKELLERENYYASEEISQTNSNQHLDYLTEHKGTRKQFPNTISNIYSSSVFPGTIAASKMNPYSTIPPIQSRSNYEDLHEVNPPIDSSFPPTGVVDHSFVRGAMRVNNMNQWQKDEFIKKESIKQKNQSNVLKQQIADKELKKQREIQEKRLEDEKEQQRIEREQIFLNEKYKREREEALKKEEEERIEKERLIREKREKEKMVEQPVQKLVMSKRGISPSNPMSARAVTPIANLEPVPFITSSPPLPAVFKRMKEQGLYTDSAESTLHIPAQKVIPEQGQKLSSIEENEEESEDYNNDTREKNEKPRISSPKLQEIIHKSEPTERKKSETSDNLMILEQLSLIQKELENEDQKLKTDIRNTEIEEKQENDNLQFKNFDKSVDSYKVHTPSTISYRETQSRESYLDLREPFTPTKPLSGAKSVSSQFRRYKPDFKNLKELGCTTEKIDLDTVEQIFAISRNIQRMGNENEEFNIDEIEKRNEDRLNKLKKISATGNNSKDILSRFMNNDDQDNSYSIPTSPSTFHRIP